MAPAASRRRRRAGPLIGAGALRQRGVVDKSTSRSSPAHPTVPLVDGAKTGEVHSSQEEPAPSTSGPYQPKTQGVDRDLDTSKKKESASPTTLETIGRDHATARDYGGHSIISLDLKTTSISSQAASSQGQEVSSASTHQVSALQTPVFEKQSEAAPPLAPPLPLNIGQDSLQYITQLTSSGTPSVSQVIASQATPPRYTNTSRVIASLSNLALPSGSLSLQDMFPKMTQLSTPSATMPSQTTSLPSLAPSASSSQSVSITQDMGRKEMALPAAMQPVLSMPIAVPAPKPVPTSSTTLLSQSSVRASIPNATQPSTQQDILNVSGIVPGQSASDFASTASLSTVEPSVRPFSVPTGAPLLGVGFDANSGEAQHTNVHVSVTSTSMTTPLSTVASGRSGIDGIFFTVFSQITSRSMTTSPSLESTLSGRSSSPSLVPPITAIGTLTLGNTVTSDRSSEGSPLSSPSSSHKSPSTPAQPPPTPVESPPTPPTLPTSPQLRPTSPLSVPTTTSPAFVTPIQASPSPPIVNQPTGGPVREAGTPTPVPPNGGIVFLPFPEPGATPATPVVPVDSSPPLQPTPLASTNNVAPTTSRLAATATSNPAIAVGASVGNDQGNTVPAQVTGGTRVIGIIAPTLGSALSPPLPGLVFAGGASLPSLPPSQPTGSPSSTPSNLVLSTPTPANSSGSAATLPVPVLLPIPIPLSIGALQGQPSPSFPVLPVPTVPLANITSTSTPTTPAIAPLAIIPTSTTTTVPASPPIVVPIRPGVLPGAGSSSQLTPTVPTGIVVPTSSNIPASLPTPTPSSNLSSFNPGGIVQPVQGATGVPTVITTGPTVSPPVPSPTTPRVLVPTPVPTPAVPTSAKSIPTSSIPTSSPAVGTSVDVALPASPTLLPSTPVPIQPLAAPTNNVGSEQGTNASGLSQSLSGPGTGSVNSPTSTPDQDAVDVAIPTSLSDTVPIENEADDNSVAQPPDSGAQSQLSPLPLTSLTTFTVEIATTQTSIFTTQGSTVTSATTFTTAVVTTSSVLTFPTVSSSRDSKVQGGNHTIAIAGGVAGVFILLVLLILMWIFITRRKGDSKAKSFFSSWLAKESPRSDQQAMTSGPNGESDPFSDANAVGGGVLPQPPRMEQLAQSTEPPRRPLDLHNQYIRGLYRASIYSSSTSTSTNDSDSVTSSGITSTSGASPTAAENPFLSASEKSAPTERAMVSGHAQERLPSVTALLSGWNPKTALAGRLSLASTTTNPNREYGYAV